MSTPLCASPRKCSSVKPLKVNSPEEWRADSVRTYVCTASKYTRFCNLQHFL